jgi:hypothetical protein
MENETVNVVGKEEKLAGRFTGRKTTAVGKVISADGKGYGSEEKIILLYTGYDCQSCVDRGFEIIKRIDSMYPARKSYIITSQSNIGFDQERNGYYKYIYNDRTELIRKELDFVLTPMIFNPHCSAIPSKTSKIQKSPSVGLVIRPVEAGKC